MNRRAEPWADCMIEFGVIRYYFNTVLLTFLVLELLLGTAELALGPLEVLLQSIDLRSQCGRGQQHSLHSHIDIFMLDSCVYLF